MQNRSQFGSMEGVLAASLRPFVRLVNGNIECETVPCTRVCRAELGCAKKRMRNTHSDVWVSWSTFSNIIKEMSAIINTEQVKAFLVETSTFNVSSDDGEEAVDEPPPSAETLRLREELRETTAKLAKSQRHNRVLVRKLKASKTHKLESPLCQVFLNGREQRYFSPRGGFSMVVRRSVTGVSARRFGLANNMDVHATTVCRWELFYCASLQGFRKAWYGDRESSLYQETRGGDSSQSIMRFVVHVHRGDATNTLKFKKKIHTTETRSQYFEMDATNETTWAELMDSSSSSRALGDLLYVENAGGLATYTMYEKQARSCGCPSWKREEEAIDKTCALQLGLLIRISISHIFWTDSGGDEEKAKSTARGETAKDTFTYAIGGACLLQQYHLMVCRSLKFSDKLCTALEPAMNAPRKYFSSVVKILHCWRDYHKKIHSRWFDLYGAAEAAKFARRRPPQALSGRWGAVDAVEAHVLAPPAAQVRGALVPIIAPSTLRPTHTVASLEHKPAVKALVDEKAKIEGNATQSKAIVEIHGTEELASEASKAYSEKQGKWRTDAGLALRDEVFVEVIMSICHESRKPLTKFYHWLLKPPEERDIDGDIRVPGKSCLVSLGQSRRFVGRVGETYDCNEVGRIFYQSSRTFARSSC